MITPQHREYAGKLSNHQDTNQKRIFQKRLLTTTLVSKSRDPVDHSDKLEGKIVCPNITKIKFWWSEWTNQMEHNRQTNCRHRKRTTLGRHLGTTRNPSPNQDSTSQPSTQEISIPFAQSKPLSVDIPVNTQGKIDIHLDNFITVIPDIGSNRARGKAAISLATHAVSRPLAQK